MTSISKSSVFLNFMYKPMGASSTGSTLTTVYILSIPESKYTTFIQVDINKYTVLYCYSKLFKKCISLLFRNVLVSAFRYQKERKITLNMMPNMPWYVKYFGGKLNYIVIFENNSSTLLMELFMICGQLDSMGARVFRIRKMVTRVTCCSILYDWAEI